MAKRKVNEAEYNLTYAALRLIEYLYQQGKIKKNVFVNILKEYSECIDISPFKSYTEYNSYQN